MQAWPVITDGEARAVTLGLLSLRKEKTEAWTQKLDHGDPLIPSAPLSFSGPPRWRGRLGLLVPGPNVPPDPYVIECPVKCGSIIHLVAKPCKEGTPWQNGPLLGLP